MRVEINGLRFGYEQNDLRHITVFNDLNLTIESGSVHAIVGPTGCGKSTLLRLIAGLETPQRGTMKLIGPQAAPNMTAIVFQDPSLVPWWTIERNIGIGVEFDPDRAQLYDKVTSFNVDRAGLKGLVHRMTNTLSKGEKTKTSIARAMAYDADVMLLDEPFTNLDVMSKRRLWAEFETGWQLDRRTYVLVTHDIDEAVLLADDVTVFSAPTSSGTTHVVDTIRVGIGRPRTPDQIGGPAYRSAVGRVWDALESGAP